MFKLHIFNKKIKIGFLQNLCCRNEFLFRDYVSYSMRNQKINVLHTKFCSRTRKFIEKTLEKSIFLGFFNNSSKTTMGISYTHGTRSALTNNIFSLLSWCMIELIFSEIILGKIRIIFVYVNYMWITKMLVLKLTQLCFKFIFLRVIEPKVDFFK